MTKDMTSGSTLRHIINFAVPLCMGMLFQQLYSMVDTMIVGKVLGVQPLAGVGATGSLNFMIIWFCIGICNGFSIPIAQAFGANTASRTFCTQDASLLWQYTITCSSCFGSICSTSHFIHLTPSYSYFFYI